jgi:hypothetical protein
MEVICTFRSNDSEFCFNLLGIPGEVILLYFQHYGYNNQSSD